MNPRRVLVIALLGVLLSPVAGAHTTLASANPPVDAVLDRSPPTIELKFKHAVQVTSIVAVDAASVERKLSFAPSVSSTVITVADPQLPPGRTELRWKALSKDGHVISGKLSYTVKAAGASP